MGIWSLNRYTYKRFKGKVVYEPEKTLWEKIKRYVCCVRKRKPILRWNASMEEAKEEEKPLDSDEENALVGAQLGKKRRKKRRSKKYLKEDSAIVIQALIRGFLGKCRAKARWRAAIQHAENHWQRSGDKQAEEIEIRRVVKMTRAKLATTYALDVVDFTARKIIQWHAAISLQRVWRGYNFRRNFKWPVKKRPRKPRLNLRYGIDVYRRNWARTAFMPSKGYWPIGKEDKPQSVVNYDYKYDVWENIDHAPKGPDFGFRTKKMFLRGNMVEEHATRKLGISAGDRIGNPETIDRDTDWFGIPTELVSKKFDDEIRYANRSKMEKLLTYTTPYLVPLFNNPPEPSKNPYAHFNSNDVSEDNLAKMMNDVGWSVELMRFNKMIETEAKKACENMWGSLRSRSLFADHEQTWADLQKNLILSSSSANISDLIQKSGQGVSNHFFVETALSLIKARKDLVNTINKENAKKQNERIFSRSRGGSPSNSRSGSPSKSRSRSVSLDGSQASSIGGGGEGSGGNDLSNITKSPTTKVPIMELMTDFREPEELLKSFKSLRNDQPLRGSYKPVSNISQSELATVRTMIYSNDPEKSSFPNKVPGTLPTGNSLMNEIDQIKQEDTKLLDKTSYRTPNPLIQYSMDPKMKPAPAKEYDPYAKYKRYSTLSTFKDANKLALEGAKGDTSQWKNSAWGKLKGKAQDATAPEANSNAEGDYNIYTDVDAQTWSRALFRPKVVVRSRAKVWASKPRSNFVLRYTWLPKRYVDHSIKHIYSNRIKGMEAFNTQRSSRVLPDTSFVTADSLAQDSTAAFTFTSSLGMDESQSTAQVRVPSPSLSPSSSMKSVETLAKAQTAAVNIRIASPIGGRRPKPPSPPYKERLTPSKDSSKRASSSSPGNKGFVNAPRSPPRERPEYYKEKLTDSSSSSFKSTTTTRKQTTMQSGASIHEEIDEGDDLSSTKFFFLKKSNLISDGDSIIKKYGGGGSNSSLIKQSFSDQSFNYNGNNDEDGDDFNNEEEDEAAAGREYLDPRATLSRGLRAIDRFGSTKDSLDTRLREKIERQKNLARQSDIIRSEVNSRRYPKEKVVIRDPNSSTSDISPERAPNPVRSGSPNPMTIRQMSIKGSTLGKGLDGLSTFSENYETTNTISNGKLRQMSPSNNSFRSMSSATESDEADSYTGSYVIGTANNSYLFKQTDNTKSPVRPGAKTLLDTMKEFDQKRADPNGVHSYPYH